MILPGYYFLCGDERMRITSTGIIKGCVRRDQFHKWLLLQSLQVETVLFSINQLNLMMIFSITKHGNSMKCNLVALYFNKWAWQAKLCFTDKFIAVFQYQTHYQHKA